MTTLPVTGYFANPARTNGEAKSGLDDAVEVARELPGGTAETELTIAAGVVTAIGGRHTIDTEADAATDDLTNVGQANHPDGRLLLIRSAANARTVVVKHAGLGAGQILLADSADYALDNTGKWLLLARQGTDWIEVLRNHGADKAAARAFLGAAGLTDANVFTKTLSWKQGADVASAANLVLGDGNSFDVTGVAPITSIASKGAGTWVLLQFDAALTLTHHATDLILPGGANITTAAGDLALANEYVAGKWRVLYQKADGTAVGAAIIKVVGSATIAGGTTTSTSFVDVTGASLSITPSSASHKIKVEITWQGEMGTIAAVNASMDVQVLRDATVISAAGGLRVGAPSGSGASGIECPCAFTEVDSPAKATAVTYKLQHKTDNVSGTARNEHIQITLTEIK